MPGDCRDQLPDLTIMVRGLRDREINHQTGKVKKDAFIPRRNGKDDDGLSVSQPAGDKRSALKARLRNTEGIFCTLEAGAIRIIEEARTPLDVCPDVTDVDEYHALIIGVPVGRDDTSKAIANRLAQRLASISSQYFPPED